MTKRQPVKLKALIEALPAVQDLVLDDKEAVEEARNAYDAFN